MTVYALQDGVTRIHDAAGSRGGIGFQELFKFVRALSNPMETERDARLTLISGTTCIQLKKPYVQGFPAQADKPRRMMWFNPENDLTRPPSSDHVFDLEDRFAGTVVGISFILDHDYLRSKVNERDQPGGADQ